MLPEINSLRHPISASKKRLLFVVTQSELGGAQQFLLTLLGRLEKSRYDITVATGSTGTGEFLAAVRKLDIEPLTIDALRRNESPFQDIRSVFVIRNLIKKLKPDTLFLNSSKAGFIGSLAAQLCRQRTNVIYRIGGWSFNDPVPSLQRRFRISLEWLSAGWKDYIIVNNRHDLEQAKQLGINPRRQLLLVHNGIDPYALDFLPREQARAALLDRIRPLTGTAVEPSHIIGTTANFYKTKGLEYLIEAAGQNADSKTIFCIIGEGQERPHLQRLIEEHRLQQKVFLIGRMDDASRYLHGFDVFVLASVKEGFPWALLEAMSAKLPVIATRVGAVPELIDDGLNGYIVEPRRPDQIAEGIAAILSSESKTKELGIQAHQKILFSFTLDSMVKAIEQIL